MKKIFIFSLALSSLVASSTVYSQSLKDSYNRSKNQEQNYESIRLRSGTEGFILKCRNMHYNFLEGYVFTFNHEWPNDPPPSHLPKKNYEKTNDILSWVWQEESVYKKNGIIYRTTPLRAEIDLTTNTRYYEDGDMLYKDTCISISTNADVRKREEIARNPNPGGWQDAGKGFSVWKGNDGIEVLGDRIREGDRKRTTDIEGHWDYSYGRRKRLN